MFNKITILGTGTMGDGIARFFARQKLAVTGYDIDQDKIVAAGNRLKDQEQIGNYLTYTSDLGAAISEADLIIESAPEDLAIKRQLYSDMAPFLKKGAIVSSNTSTYPLASLISGQPFGSRMIITHFFNPADLIPLVEIVQHENTIPGLAEDVASFLRQSGKVPVVLKKDINGFVANRLQAAVLREACFLVENGIAGVADIDTIMTEGLGIRWAINGPFRIADLGGLDVWQKVCENLLPELSRETGTPAIIKEMVKVKKLGLKSGEGFYRYGSQTNQVQTNQAQTNHPHAKHASDYRQTLIELLQMKRTIEKK